MKLLFDNSTAGFELTNAEGNVIINWGDGTMEEVEQSPGARIFFHEYSEHAEWEVIITGNFDEFRVGLDIRGGNVKKVLEWGENNTRRYQLNSPHLIEVPNTLPGNITNCEKMFYQAFNFNCPNVTEWDVSNVKNMREMFAHAYNFNQDLSIWNPSSLENMKYMFYKAYNYTHCIGCWMDKCEAINCPEVSGAAALSAYNYRGAALPGYRDDVDGILAAEEEEERLREEEMAREEAEWEAEQQRMENEPEPETDPNDPLGVLGEQQ